jgi:CubicO group peptidase (beta-lactamase class C family)
MSDLDLARLEAILRDVAAAHPASGFGVAAFAAGRVLEVATGTANPELDLPMTTDTLVQIGSSTKLLNAALVMRLVELEALDLDQPVRKVVDGFRLADDFATDVLTLRHCLTMTSGLDGGPYDDLGGDQGHLARYVALLADIPQLFPPGTGYGYGNASALVAGLAAECATGQAWDALLQEHIVRPAGLKHTLTTADQLMYHRVAVGIDPEGSVIRPWYLSRSMGPAGSTCASTAGDLVRFVRRVLSGGPDGGEPAVLSADTVRLMTESAVEVPTGFPAEAWGLGVGRTEVGGQVILGHPGFNQSGCSVVWWVPGLDVAVACVANSPMAFPAVLDCANAVLAELGSPLPQRPEVTESALDDAADAVGVYENLHLRYEVTVDGDGLQLVVAPRGDLYGAGTTTHLRPAGRFGWLPEQPMMPGFTVPQPFAFRDYGGARVLLDGHEPARRVRE